MNIVGALVVFVVVWWLVFFTVLPWGIVSQVEDEDVEPGTEPGAPARPMLVRKAAITTLIACAICALIYLVIAGELINLGTIQPDGAASD